MLIHCSGVLDYHEIRVGFVTKHARIRIDCLTADGEGKAVCKIANITWNNCAGGKAPDRRECSLQKEILRTLHVLDNKIRLFVSVKGELSVWKTLHVMESGIAQMGKTRLIAVIWCPFK